MAATTEIITTTEVIELALTQKKVDPVLLDNDILPAQREYIKKFLGVEFYDEILTQVDAASLTPDNTELLEDYLKPMLAHFVVYVAFPHIQLEIGSKGVMKNISETSEPASNREAANLRNNFDYKGNLWRNDATEFIRESKEADPTKFPLFNKKTNSQNTKTGPIFYETRRRFPRNFT